MAAPRLGRAQSTCSQRQPIKVNWPPVDEKPLEAEATVQLWRGLCLPLCLRPALLPADTCPVLTNELVPLREEATGGGAQAAKKHFLLINFPGTLLKATVEFSHECSPRC